MAYYGVRKVIENGQKRGIAQEEPPSITEDHVLVGIMSNGVWAVAVNLTKKSRYRQFYNSCAQGRWVNMDLYEVSKDKIEDCPNEGKVLINELEEILKYS